MPCTERYPHPMSDLEIVRRNIPFHEESSGKGVRDSWYTDEGQLSEFKGE